MVLSFMINYPLFMSMTCFKCIPQFLYLLPVSRINEHYFVITIRCSHTIVLVVYLVITYYFHAPKYIYYYSNWGGGGLSMSLY